jgi:TPP-dependent pyruvate/acetoin dehydrogenase alpha subunit
MGIPSERIDGQDVWAVRAAAERAVERARAGEGPVFLEAHTYRYSDHGRGDPIQYRPEGEMEEWRQRDPLDIARTRLGEKYGIADTELDSIVSEVEAEIERVTTAALEAPFPEPDPEATEFAA